MCIQLPGRWLCWLVLCRTSESCPAGAVGGRYRRDTRHSGTWQFLALAISPPFTGYITPLWHPPASRSPLYCSNLRKQKLEASLIPVAGEQLPASWSRQTCWLDAVPAEDAAGRPGRTSVPETFMVALGVFEPWIWTGTVLHLKCHC